MKIPMRIARLLAMLFLALTPVLVSAQVDDDDDDRGNSRIKVKPISDDEEEEESRFLDNHRIEIGMQVSPHLKGDIEEIGVYYGPTLDWVFLNAPVKISAGLNFLNGSVRSIMDNRLGYSNMRDTGYYYNLNLKYTQLPLMAYVNLSDEESPRWYLGLGATLNYLSRVSRVEIFDVNGREIEGRTVDFYKENLSELGYNRLSIGFMAGLAIDTEIGRDFTLGVQPYLSYVYMPNKLEYTDFNYEQAFYGIQFRFAYNFLSALKN